MATLKPTLRQRFAALIRPGLSTLLAPIDKAIARRTSVKPLMEHPTTGIKAWATLLATGNTGR